jgi:hypothetical protein
MAQSAWLGPAVADVDSATKYDAPQDGQTQSDIFIASAEKFFFDARMIRDQCDISEESFVRKIF